MCVKCDDEGCAGMGRILVIGSMNMDMTIFTHRVPQSGETLSGYDFLLSPGGKGANQAVAASRMGAETTMFGCVGDDVFGGELIAALTGNGVDTAPIRRIPGVATGAAAITVCDADNRIILYAGANAHVRPGREALRALISGCDALLLQLEIPLETVFEAINVAHGLGKLVFLTPAPAAVLREDIYPKVDYLLPNESEASLLMGRALASDQDMLEALSWFERMGVKHSLITLGDRGVGCVLDGKPQIRRGFSVKAVDTTAAGDTFTGALALAITDGDSLPDAIDFAQKAAAVCVTRQGAQNAIPTRAEVLALELPKAIP